MELVANLLKDRRYHKRHRRAPIRKVPGTLPSQVAQIRRFLGFLKEPALLDAHQRPR